jgi:hypothetical protein
LQRERLEACMWIQARTLTGYLVGVIIVLVIINVVAGILDAPRRYGLAVFSAGFVPSTSSL